MYAMCHIVLKLVSMLKVPRTHYDLLLHTLRTPNLRHLQNWLGMGIRYSINNRVSNSRSWTHTYIHLPISIKTKTPHTSTPGAGWMSWRAASRIISNQRVSVNRSWGHAATPNANPVQFQWKYKPSKLRQKMCIVHSPLPWKINKYKQMKGSVRFGKGHSAYFSVVAGHSIRVDFVFVFLFSIRVLVRTLSTKIHGSSPCGEDVGRLRLIMEKVGIYPTMSATTCKLPERRHGHRLSALYHLGSPWP